MKFIHLSDLHLGKRLNEYSLIEDQKYILEQILTHIDSEKPQGVFIAGDVYDKAVPSAEAVQLFDLFLAELAKRRLQVFVISGNHDSPERIAFGESIMAGGGIHLSPVYNGTVTPTELEDEFGKLYVYLLPFVKPAHIRRFFEDEAIESYTDAIRVAVDAMKVDTEARNVLLTHQFVTGATKGGSEDEFSVGGTDNVDASVFAPFDYVALGHIHGAQNCGDARIRYCGTPLKYSFSEAKHQKSVTVLEIGEKAEGISVRTLPLTPLREMQEIKGSFEELTALSYYSGKSYTEDYMHITLTDEDDVPNAVGRLREIYKNLMRLDYDNTRTRTSALITGADKVQEKSALELFEEFFLQQNGTAMTEEQTAYMEALIKGIEEGDNETD